MDPERWRLIERVFHEVLERPPSARAELLGRRCGADAELRAAVERLLAVDDTEDDLIARWGAIPEAAFSERHPRPDPLVGRQIGAYRLVARIAAGGMGVVYRAVRADGLYEREVAVKLVRGEVPSELALRRFDVERRLLATLDHPHIARLYDGGTTAEGTPYLVMEYVHGLPIDRWCDEKQLSISERLELFVTVCRTVHFAHENLVVHGDLKPPNILVDESGAVKLLDFGLARLLEAEGRVALERTATIARLLTPEYASPEQWRGQPLTTATDVYSLAVVSYLLLTGRKPLQCGDQSAGEWERMLTQQEARRPSACVLAPRSVGALEDVEPAPEVVASKRRSTPARLARALRGDLDRIVLMALRKDPARRYPSALALAEDVESHLRGLPVRAREDSLAYRTTTFVRRNRLAVAAGLVVLAAPSAALVFSLRAEARARRDEAHARIEAESFRRIADLHLAALLAGRPEDAPLRRESLRETVLGQADHVRNRYSGELHLQANLLDALGLFSLRTGAAAEEARALLEEARALRQREFGERSLEVALSLRSLAELEKHEGRPERAAALLEQALALHRGSDEVHTDVALAVTELAEVLLLLGRRREAEALFEEALALRRARQGPRGLLVAESLELLARALLARGAVERAKEHVEEALSIRRTTLGEDDADTRRTSELLTSLRARKSP